MPTPLTAKLVALIHEIEDGTRELSRDNLAELRALMLQERSMTRATSASPDQTVIVTGAAHGFGRTIAHAFATEGAAVWACDVNTEGLSETARLAQEDAAC